METIEITKPFNGHVHFRNGQMMKDVVPYTAQHYFGGVCMGNLPGDEVIDTIEKNLAYKGAILEIAPSFKAIVPLMVTQNLLANRKTIFPAAKKLGIRVYKFLPGGLSTNGSPGLSLYDFYTPAFREFFELLIENDCVFSCHFEVEFDTNGKKIDPRYQEEQAILFLQYLLRNFPKLKIMVEHASSWQMIHFIRILPRKYRIGVTLAIHHASITFPMVINWRGKFVDSRLYCKPIAKYPKDREAVIEAMFSGDPRFFLGTDSAPHLLEAKIRKEKPAAGIFSDPISLQKYAELFDAHGKRKYFENFASIFGPEFYGLDPSKEKITLVKEAEKNPKLIAGIPVFLGGGETAWRVKN